MSALSFLADPNAAQAGASSQPAPAPPPATAMPGPPSGGGGIGSLGGIGTAISNAMSGGGIFGDTSGDATVDPATGIPVGISRRANNQSLMKMGLMLMAAGSRQSDDSRAKILAGMGGAIGGETDQMNSFAKTRLEMAKMKLLERQQLQEEASGNALRKMLGGDTTASPGATAVTAAQSGNASVAPAVGAPIPAPAAVAGATPPLDPQTTGATTPAPAPAPTTGGPITPHYDDKPSPPAAPDFMKDATPAERRIVGMMKPNEAIAAIAKWQEGRAGMETEGKPFKDTTTGQLLVPVYRNGQLIGTRSKGTLTPDVVDVPDANGDVQRKTVVGGHTTAIMDVRDPVSAENRASENKAITEDRNTLVKTYDEAVKPALVAHDRLGKILETVKTGKVITGPGADARVSVVNALASAGYLDKSKIQELINSKRLEQELAVGAGEFAKKYEGPQISNFDVQNAARIMGASLSNDKNVLASSIDRLRQEHRQTIEAYQEKSGRHNSTLPESYTGTHRQRLSAPVVDKKFDDDKPAQVALPAGATQADLLAEARRRGLVK